MSALVSYRSRAVDVGALTDENAKLTAENRQLRFRLAAAETEAEAWRQRSAAAKGSEAPRRGAAETRHSAPVAARRFSAGELGALELLARGIVVDAERMVAAYEAAAGSARKTPARILVYKLRHKLSSLGVHIETVVYHGYRVPMQDLAALKAAIEGERHE